jgi:hypothetical protein
MREAPDIWLERVMAEEATRVDQLARMGLEDRDYMRDVPVYRELVSGYGGPRRPDRSSITEAPNWDAEPLGARAAHGKPRTRPWAWFLLGVVTTLWAIVCVASHTLIV